jgi:hypothetical protein
VDRSSSRYEDSNRRFISDDLLTSSGEPQRRGTHIVAYDTLFAIIVADGELDDDRVCGYVFDDKLDTYGAFLQPQYKVMDLADDSRRSLKASLLPPQSFTSLQDQLAEMPSSDYEMKPEDFQSLQHLDGNKECIDCGAANPDWGSPHLGILFCAQCSGHHR